MNKKLQNKFIVFEMTQGWYIKEQTNFEIKLNNGFPIIQEPEASQWVYINNKPVTGEVLLTSNLLFAQKFSEEDVVLYQDAFKINFVKGIFKKVELTLDIDSISHL